MKTRRARGWRRRARRANRSGVRYYFVKILVYKNSRGRGRGPPGRARLRRAKFTQKLQKNAAERARPGTAAFILCPRRRPLAAVGRRRPPGATAGPARRPR
ncbi:hypothetical protein EVAR_15999_1 [Eumeta japonica]|uniref:Uncharacterized protein n=1 Tax=Eumeta variegata TaxID=151549 RepID=A0A4C1UML0_EUMVA|nr:hypothetical protein EVAR_15999_1 [Eumeta japonica]